MFVLLLLQTGQVKWLELILRGCVCKHVKNGDRVVALNQYRQLLVQEDFLTVVLIIILNFIPSV